MSMELKDDLPAMSPTVAAAAMKTYQLVCRAMLTQDDYQRIGDKEFKKKSAWRKLARAFNISDEIIKEIQEPLEKGGFIWRIHVKATAPNGRASIGVGSCSTRERAFAHIDHDIYAIAHTRAKNRAIADLIGSGEVSAEELEAPKTEIDTGVKKTQWTQFGPEVKK